MFIGHFTERPYQDPNSGYFGATGRPMRDLSISNAEYDPRLGAQLYNRYLDERLYAEEMGFDGLMLNEHHSTPFCMGGVMNVEAGILARITKRAKIVLMGNVLPIWDDPLWLAEELAIIDMISEGRLVTGWVRGGGRESVAHNAQPPFNWERFQEAHDFIVKAWTTPGPFRWEGEHYRLPLRQPVGASLPAAPPADLDPRGDEQEHRGVGGEAPLPLRHARHAAGADEGVLRLLPPVRGGGGVRGRHAAHRLPVEGARGRDGGTRPGDRPQVLGGSREHLPGGQPRGGVARPPEPPRG